jgi:hypothetical protein
MGLIRPGVAGLAGRVRRGLAGSGMARQGMAGVEWHGVAGQCNAWTGMARRARPGSARLARHGSARHGVAGPATNGASRMGEAWPRRDTLLKKVSKGIAFRRCMCYIRGVR